MPNPDYSENFNNRHQGGMKHKSRKAGGRGKMPEKTANWPGLPGKAQGKDRSGGVKKAKVYPSSKGL